MVANVTKARLRCYGYYYDCCETGVCNEDSWALRFSTVRVSAAVYLPSAMLRVARCGTYTPSTPPTLTPPDSSTPPPHHHVDACEDSKKSIDSRDDEGHSGTDAEDRDQGMTMMAITTRMLMVLMRVLIVAAIPVKKNTTKVMVIISMIRLSCSSTRVLSPF